MPVSEAAAAGIGVGCAFFTFIITFPAVLWLREWFLRGIPPDSPDPFLHEDRLLRFGQLIREATEIENVDSESQRYQVSLKVLELSQDVDTFVHTWTCREELNGNAAPYDSAKFHRLAGGPHEDWDKLLEFDQGHRRSALVHLICRVLHPRMIPDGDPSITLLPADMLSTYQRMLGKLSPKGWLIHDLAETARTTTMLRQYWRAFTVFCISENYSKLEKAEAAGSPKSNAIACHWWVNDGKECQPREDDPRMPNILAVEATLKDALKPFWRDSSHEPSDTKPFETPRARKMLRRITARAADIALIAFSQVEPIEFYWPADSSRRPSIDRYEYAGDATPGGYLQCFGTRQRKPSPGSEGTRYNQVVETDIPIGPVYSDTAQQLHELYVIRSIKNHGRELRDIRERVETNNGVETDSDKYMREHYEKCVEKLELAQKSWDSRPKVLPGWQGATNFF